ncbi:hypothetical protein NLJ89_g2021 [Agrocybe chaxingu]|uniref:Uncharacterized protein n=1 Tax=Agrocybe chaxingu TaxID=84603 RepID=A0A9W8MYV8_9AGAR|nr:hypothetical protein NLJ89_g2021 [Agrocybe chaxingu]
MVVPSPLTHDQLFAQLETQYHHKFVPASALFWTQHGQHAMRLEVPSLMREFKDKMTVGRDPEGYLFYNHVEDLDLERGTRYIMFPNTYRTKQDHAVVVQFFHNDPSKCYAQFIAKDENLTVDYCIDNGNVGEWTQLVQGCSHAKIRKYSDENTVTLTAAPIGKKATFQLNNDQNIPETWGELIFKHISDLNTPGGTKGFVDFTPDRVLFYPKQMNPEFTAIFIPSEAIEKPAALGTASVETQTVEWSNI